MDLKSLTTADSRYKDVLQTILDFPYVEYSVLEEKLHIAQPDLQQLLEKLSQDMFILELAGQADSSLESRVPKKVYLINPEQEKLIREYL